MYRLRQMDVDDKVCEQINPGIVETIYPKELIEQCLQESEQWTGTKRRVRESTGLSLGLFVMMLGLWSRLNQQQVWQKLVGGLGNLHPEDPLWQMSSSALTGRPEELNASREQLRERYHLLSLEGPLSTRSSNSDPAS